MAALPKFSFSGWNSSSLAPKVNPATTPGALGMMNQAPSAGGATPGALTGLPANPTSAQLKAWAAAARGGYSLPKAPPGATAPIATPRLQSLGTVGTAMPIGPTGAGGGGITIENGIVYQNGVPIPGATGAIAGAATGATPGQLVGTTNAANTNLPAWLQSEVDRLNAQQALRTQMAGQVTGAPAPTQNIGDILQGVAANTAARGQFNTSLNQINEQARLQSLIQQRNQIRPVGGFGFMNPLDTNRSIGLDREIEAYRNVNLPLAAGAASGRMSGWTSPYVNPFRTF